MDGPGRRCGVSGAALWRVRGGSGYGPGVAFDGTKQGRVNGILVRLPKTRGARRTMANAPLAHW